MDEMGMEAEIVGYLGPIVSHFKNENQDFETEKTTLYFLCKYKSDDPGKKKKDQPEGAATLMWNDPKTLIEKMREQRARLHREDIDESNIVEKAARYL